MVVSTPAVLMIIYVSNITSTEEVVKNYEEVFFKLSPNPASTQETIKIHFYNLINSPDYQISFHALDGRLVYDHKLALGVQNTEIPFNNFTSGGVFCAFKARGKDGAAGKICGEMSRE
ncbi:MAG: hypothetical protein ACJAYJ_002110 [Saprospiraceae bacterium]|jgi:hypothetical protein